MTGPVGRAAAKIEIVGDASKFAATLKRDVDRALSTLKLNAAPLAKQIGDSFERGAAEATAALNKFGDKAENTLQTVSRNADVSFDHVSQDAKNTAVQTGTSFSAIASQGEAAFNHVARDAQETALRTAVSFGHIAREATAAAAQTGVAFESGGEVAERALEELDRSATTQFAQITAKARGSAAAMGASFSGAAALMKTAAITGVAALAAGLGALTVAGLKSAASLEQIQIGMESLLGSADKATAFLAELQTFAAATPFAFEGVADASRRILAFGQSVGITQKQVIPTLTTIGDLVAVLGGTQESVDSVVRAFGQMASKGKLSQEEILQLAEALPGFNANAAIASGLGLSVADTLKLISSGGVDATTGINALLSGMAKFQGAAGAMERQSQTLVGVFSTFKDTIQIALAGAFAPVIPEIKTALSQITPIVGQAVSTLAPALGGLLTSLLPQIAGIVSGLAPILAVVVNLVSTLVGAVGPAITGLLGALAPILTALGPAITALIGPFTVLFKDLFADAGPAINDFVAAVGTSLVPIMAAWGPAMTQVADALRPMIPALVSMIPPLTEMVVALTPLIVLFAQWTAASVPLIKVTVAVFGFLAAMKPLGLVVLTVIKAITGFSKSLGGVGEQGSKIGDFFAAVGGWFASVGRWFAGLGRWFADLPGKVVAFLTSLPGLVIGLFQQAFEGALMAVGMGIGLIIFSITTLPGLVMDKLLALPPLIGAFFTNLWNTAWANTVAGIDVVVAYVTGLPERVWNALVALGPMIANAFTAAVNWGKQALIIGFAQIFAFVQSVPGRLAGFVGNFLAAGRNLIQGLISGISNAGGFVGDLAGKIVGTIKGFLNNVIGKINSGIASIDDLLPGSLPRIPMLAAGAVIRSPTLAGLGEAGPEVVIPLTNAARARQLVEESGLDQLLGEVRMAGAGATAGGIEVRVYLGTREITDIIDVQIFEHDRKIKSLVTAGSGRRR